MHPWESNKTACDPIVVDSANGINSASPWFHRDFSSLPWTHSSLGNLLPRQTSEGRTFILSDSAHCDISLSFHWNKPETNYVCGMHCTDNKQGRTHTNWIHYLPWFPLWLSVCFLQWKRAETGFWLLFLLALFTVTWGLRRAGNQIPQALRSEIHSVLSSWLPPPLHTPFHIWYHNTNRIQQQTTLGHLCLDLLQEQICEPHEEEMENAIYLCCVNEARQTCVQKTKDSRKYIWLNKISQVSGTKLSMFLTPIRIRLG